MVPNIKGIVLILGITPAAMAEAMKLQKMKLMTMNTLQGNGNKNGTESGPDDLNSNTGEYLQDYGTCVLLIYSETAKRSLLFLLLVFPPLPCHNCTLVLIIRSPLRSLLGVTWILTINIY